MSVPPEAPPPPPSSGDIDDWRLVWAQKVAIEAGLSAAKVDIEIQSYPLYELRYGMGYTPAPRAPSRPTAAATALSDWVRLLEARDAELDAEGRQMSEGEHSVWMWELEQHEKAIRHPGPAPRYLEKAIK